MKSNEHCQLSAVGSLNWNMALSEMTGKSPTSVGVDLWVRVLLRVINCFITVCFCVCVSVCTCRAPFLLKEDTHCIRRHISSATDSTILDKTRGTRSLETVKTWDREVGDERIRWRRHEETKKNLVNAGFDKRTKNTRSVHGVEEVWRLFVPQHELWWCWPELPSGSSLHLREKRAQHEQSWNKLKCNTCHSFDTFQLMLIAHTGRVIQTEEMVQVRYPAAGVWALWKNNHKLPVCFAL